MTKTNVESFELDHTKVQAPYIRLAGTKTGPIGDTIYKFDIRFKQPNQEFMPMDALHSIEHLMAENIRNHTKEVIDLSPMGCQTGFYLTLISKHTVDEVSSILVKTLQDVLAANEVPACNVVQCGWAANHSLEGAKQLATDMLAEQKQWAIVFAEE